MTAMNSIAAYWYYHLPNFVMAAVMYTLLARALLGLIVGPDTSNYIFRFFCAVTDPVIAVFQRVTPLAVAPVVLWLFSFVWLFWLRVVFHLTLLSFDLAPRFGGTAS